MGDNFSIYKDFSAVKNATGYLKRTIEVKNDLQEVLKNIERLGINLADCKPKKRPINNVESVKPSTCMYE